MICPNTPCAVYLSGIAIDRGMMRVGKKVMSQKAIRRAIKRDFKILMTDDEYDLFVDTTYEQDG
jgi:hypothetical protein